MYKLYIKIAIRYLFKNKLYSFINIAGLAVGIASFILIMLYVNHERSYDKFEGSENVYRVFMDFKEGDTFEVGDAQTSNYIGPTLTSEFPEVLDYVRFYRFDKVTFKNGEKLVEEKKGALADPSYFEIFNHPLVSGDVATALKEPNSIVLTESLAKKIFGNENPIKKTLRAYYGEEVLLTVTGVLKDIPRNTHMKNNFLVSFSTIASWSVFEDVKELNWADCSYFTYLKVNESANKTLLTQKVIASDFEEDEDERYNLEPMEDIHLYSNKPFEAEANGSISRVKFLLAIAFIILILSWLNYVNLSTSKSLERAKEVGIRKVSGAQKTQLIFGSLTESIVLNMIAMILAVGLTAVMLSVYENKTGTALVVQSVFIKQLLPILGFVFLGIILAGMYPAFLLSSYSPAKALKGKIATSVGGFQIRKAMITTQFLATIVLLIGTITVTKQIDFLEKQPIGANLERTISFHGELLTKDSDSLIRSKFRALQRELNTLPFINATTRSQTFPGDGYDNLGSFVGMGYPDGTEDSRKVFYNYSTQSDYFDLLNIKFLAGETFLDNPQGQSRSIVINEEALKRINITSPENAISKTLDFFGETWTIVGVVENYHHFGFKSPVQPIIILHANSSENLLVKFDKSIAASAGYTTAINQVRDKWMRVFPESTFNYTFIDKKFDAQYQDDRQFSNAFTIFTLLAALIACLGLFGLTAYTCIQRKKEIGIRKVNGATIGQILALLNKDFITQVGIAFIIAVPIAWYAMNNWLANFAYKTTLSWWVFALAGILVIVVALLTVSWQSFRAAVANPVEALKEE
mgnify:CR=1 FL=1